MTGLVHMIILLDVLHDVRGLLHHLWLRLHQLLPKSDVFMMSSWISLSNLQKKTSIPCGLFNLHQKPHNVEMSRPGSIVQASVASIVLLTSIDASVVKNMVGTWTDRKYWVPRIYIGDLERSCLTLSSSPSRAAAQIPREKSSSAGLFKVWQEYIEPTPQDFSYV